MAAPVSAELLAGAKLWCNITWSDEATDAKVSALIASGEAYIDGKKVETIEMPYDYIKRKYDIFYNYDLEEGPHKLVIKWINPNEKYAVQCKDMVVYSSTPAEPINPYK